VKKNTKGELQNPFNQFFKILLCESYRQIAPGRYLGILLFYVSQPLFIGTFYSQTSTGLEIKLVLG